jgi:hypothetical protein
METTTETNPNNRELTKTEIAITIAQIEDRLRRWLNASQELIAIWETDQARFTDEDFLNEKPFRDKYAIPYGVCLFPGEAINKEDIPVFMKFAKWWVKGEMTDEAFELFTFHFCEIVEVDFFWVLMDQPGFYYHKKWHQLNGQLTYKDLENELRKIGTRSKKKCKINFKLNIGHGW